VLKQLGRRKEAQQAYAKAKQLRLRGEESIEEAMWVAPYVNGILLDSGNPFLAVKELGGTGRMHNWEISKKIREAVEVPIFLAGGLKAENVGRAIRQVGPFGLDWRSYSDRLTLVPLFKNLFRLWHGERGISLERAGVCV